MQSNYSFLYDKDVVVARKIFPDNIQPVFITGDGIHNFAQYKKNNKLYSSFFNIDRVLMEYEDTYEKRILFDGNYAISIENSKYYLSDPNLIMRSTIAELLKAGPLSYNDQVVGIGILKNFDLKVVAYQNKNSFGTYNKETECFLAFYKINDRKLYNPLLPEYVQSIKIVGGVNNIISLDENMATYYTKPTSQVRTVSVDANLPIKYTHPTPFSNQYSLTRDKFENVGSILIYHNNWELVTYFDYTKKIVLSTYNINNNDAIFQYFIKSKMYNQMYQMNAFSGSYTESMNFDDLQQTQNFSIGGYFDDKAIAYNLTTEILTSDGYFIRGLNKAINNVSRIEVTLNNLVILNDYYIIFYVKAFTANGLPAPDVKVTVTIPNQKIPEVGTSEQYNGDTNDLRRYFDPSIGGIDSDSAKTELDGAAYLFVKSVNADIANHLQGYWWFKIDASGQDFYSFNEVVNYHKTNTMGRTNLDEFRNEIRAKYNPTLPFIKPHFTQNI